LLHFQEKRLKDYPIGPWFEGFTFVKRTAHRKLTRKMPNLPETSQQQVLALLARLGELVATNL
jgi:hypothetical protein